MEGISDLGVGGIDEMRPPRIRQVPYNKLFFKLILKAPRERRDRLSHLVAKRGYPV
jgi:hypothetical protein